MCGHFTILNTLVSKTSILREYWVTRVTHMHMSLIVLEAKTHACCTARGRIVADRGGAEFLSEPAGRF